MARPRWRRLDFRWLLVGSTLLGGAFGYAWGVLAVSRIDAELRAIGESADLYPILAPIAGLCGFVAGGLLGLLIVGIRRILARERAA